MNKQDLIDIRDATPNDKAFVFATWLRGLRYGNAWFNLIDKSTYFTTYHKVLEHVLTSGVTVKVACLKEDPSVILGYAVYKGDRLDWVFCKKIWRNIGIAKSLVPEGIQRVSHVTDLGVVIMKKKGWIFDPFNP